MDFDKLYEFVNLKYNEKYQEEFGTITKDMSTLFYEQFGNDFIDWVKNVNKETAYEVIMFPMYQHNIAYDEIIEKLDKEGHFDEENQSLFKTIDLNPKLVEKVEIEEIEEN